MQKREEYKQTKYKIKKGKIDASYNTKYVNNSSWLSTQLIAKWYEMILPQFVKGDLLDLGCGAVPLYDAYKDYVESVTCADWGNSVHENKFLDVTCDINTKLPFNNNSFDTIILSDVLEHVIDIRYTLSEVKRLLRPNGVVILNTPFMYWMHELPYDYCRYTPYLYESIAKELNLECNTYKVGGVKDVLIDNWSKLQASFWDVSMIKWKQMVYFYTFRNWIINSWLNKIPNWQISVGVVLKNVK